MSYYDPPDPNPYEEGSLCQRHGWHDRDERCGPCEDEREEEIRYETEWAPILADVDDGRYGVGEES